MNAVFFKGIAIFAFLMDAIVLWGFVRSLVMEDMAASGFIGLSVRVGGIVVLLTMIGIGLFYLRKWAAVFASIFFSYVGIRLLYDVSSMQGGRTWLIVSLSILFLIPLIGTIRYWSTLKPGGRWYL
jgi:hypothetical protein